jgi:hypothetical protein
MTTLRGRLENSKGENVLLEGCRVEVFFTQLVVVETGDGAAAPMIRAVVATTPRVVVPGDTGLAAGDARRSRRSSRSAAIGALSGAAGPTATAATTATAVSPATAGTSAGTGDGGTGAGDSTATEDARPDGEGTGETAPQAVSGRVATLTDYLGKFVVTVPDAQDLARPSLEFVVSSPAGQRIGGETRKVEGLDIDNVRITVRKVDTIPLTPPTNLPEPLTRRVTGRVIERNGRALPASLQVLIFARAVGSTAPQVVGTDPPVLVARADATGYFFGDAPNTDFGGAAAIVAGVANEIPIALEGSRIPQKIALVIELPAADAPATTKDDCDCEPGAAPPRTPSHEDIDAAPETYSVDLGTGRCIQFNTPNRAIEEFDFFTVVRTTEPEITGLTLADENLTGHGNPPIGHRLPPPPPPSGYVPPPPGGSGGNVPPPPPGGSGGPGQPSGQPVHTATAVMAMTAQPSGASAVVLGDKLTERGYQLDKRLEKYLGGLRPPGRGVLNSNNPVDWDSTPTFYEAATIAHGHLLHYKQVWYADGYSLGDLLYSLPLAPGQKKLISVVDWERREQAERTEATFGSEQLSAALSRDRDLGEVVTGALTESSRGGSKSTSAGVGVGTGTAGNGSYQGFNFGALIGVSGGYGESNSNAWQDSARTLSTSSVQNLRDRTLQSASAIRGIRSSVVHTVAQGEAVRATTEVVANHNHCHALTIQYFEVLRHLKLVHELADVQECLFVPLPMSEFTLEKALRWRQPLETYLQKRQLAPGFDALRRVLTNWTEVDYPLGRYADESVRSIAGEIQLTVIIPLPPFPERPKPDPADTAADAATKLEQAVNPTTGPMGIFLAIATGGASLIAGAVTDTAIAATKAATQGARALADEMYALSPQERYDKFQQEVMPGLVAGFVDQLELWALVGNTEMRVPGADFTLVSTYQPGLPLLVGLRGTLQGSFARADYTQLRIKSEAGLPSGCRVIVNSATIRYRTPTFEHAFVDDLRVNDDIDLPKVTATTQHGWEVTIQRVRDGEGASLYTPIDSWEQRSPRLEDWRLAWELVDHLNDNLEFYHHAIWWTMDPNRRYMLLDGYVAPGAQGRSVASVVENRLIGIVGNSLVMPVADGNHLDPRFNAVTGQTVDMRDFYRVDPPVPASRVSLPTRGVFAEAVMGQCNACEQIDDTRFWRWEDSPIDEPPGIEAASTATRRGEPPDVQPSQFPAPIVSIQNAPTAPDPIGVRAALDTLAKQSFTDITGLAGTQANAAAAYQQALDTAFKFGKEASVLAQAASMNKNIDKTMDAIDKADTGNKIDKDTAKDLRTTALKKLVGDDTSGKVDTGDVQKKLDVISNAAKNNQVPTGAAQDISKSVLKTLTGAGSDTGSSEMLNELGRQLDPKALQSLKQGADGSFEIQQALFQGTDVGSQGVGDAVRWWDLLGFRPPQNLIDGLVARDLSWQRIVDGYGDVNLDFYLMEITKLPKDPAGGAQFSPEAFFEYVRIHFPEILIEYPGMVGPSLEEYEAADLTKWKSAAPLGAVMKFRIDARPYADAYPSFPSSGLAIPEWGLVLCAEHSKDGSAGDWHWNFVTVTGNGLIGYHPVSGTRQFGLRKSDTSYMFYVRAADRVTTIAEYALSPLVFSGGDRYWRGFFENLSTFITDNGGTATMGPIYSHRHPWGLVTAAMPKPPPTA